MDIIAARVSLDGLHDEVGRETPSDKATSRSSESIDADEQSHECSPTRREISPGDTYTLLEVFHSRVLRQSLISARMVMCRGHLSLLDNGTARNL